MSCQFVNIQAFIHVSNWNYNYMCPLTIHSKLILRHQWNTNISIIFPNSVTTFLECQVIMRLSIVVWDKVDVKVKAFYKQSLWQRQSMFCSYQKQVRSEHISIYTVVNGYMNSRIYSETLLLRTPWNEDTLKCEKPCFWIYVSSPLKWGHPLNQDTYICPKSV